MDKYKKVLTGIFIFIVLLISFYIYFQFKKSQITYYAKLEKISTSGETRFRWYDTELQKVIDPDNQYSWFFAMPVDVPDDLTATKNWVEYLQNNSDSIFKIIGTKSRPDCDYYDKDHCIENIDISSIEIVSL